MASIIPWTFLNVDLALPIPNTTHATPVLQRKTFAQALNNAYDIPVSQLPTLCIKGDIVFIKIPEDEYQAGSVECKNNLYGRILFPKGAKPLTFLEIKALLKKQWVPLIRWNMVSIGRGFLEFSFSLVEDLRRVLTMGAWTIGPGMLRLFLWTPDFYLNRVKTMNTQCWVHIYVPKKYWWPKVLFSIARGVGLPLSLDEATKNRTFGQYARVLVDVDLL